MSRRNVKCLTVLQLAFVTSVLCSIKSWYMDHFKSRNIFYCSFAFLTFLLLLVQSLSNRVEFFSAGCTFAWFSLRAGANHKKQIWKKNFGIKVRLMGSGFYLLYFAVCAAFGSHKRTNLAFSLWWPYDSRMIIVWKRTCRRSSCYDMWPCFASLLRGRSEGHSSCWVLWGIFLPSFSKFRFNNFQDSGWGCYHS